MNSIYVIGKLLLTLFLIFFPFCYNLFAVNLAEINKLSEYAKSIVLMDFDTKRILYSKKPNLVFPPASLTKIVTIYTALIEAEKRNIKLKSIVPISDSASYYNAPPNSSLMFLEKGQIVNFEEILKGLSVSSGNDSSIAIAEFVVGNLNSFVNLMNINVLNLGLFNMRFVEPSGYSSENKITALDMAFFVKSYIEKFKFMLNIHSLKYFIYPKSRNLGTALSSKFLNLKQRNANLLIYDYPYSDGIKTGYIKESGLNLVATAKKGERRLIAVVLGVEKGINGFGEKMRSSIAKNLFEYGFNKYSKFPLIVKLKEKVYNGTVDTVALFSKEPFYYILTKDEFDKINISYTVDKLVAPLSGDMPVGRAMIFLENEKIGDVALFSGKVKRLGFWQGLYKSFINLFSREY
ncbi:D-alanyl-D-alanine carboxypeptidase [Borreliella burgdorferi]|uniref:D-alanyl-D-alanine carboxypeptidase family protein n=1 Tax=Borreliella burgdorferi TaxID=139 RepID=UPI001E5EC980|nr:D-alanyl-D-alanine carboxypeptidase family protein [Borreliella burgdorferi]MCD2321735.1 D-alanyl-D-alanine carboxypeptidase [Borreliella burgdorferi]MCD2409290.1 D-alanyl-D-alanine carboxypeptidase [Borreliella burgdorferi]MCD2415055.1 D-alanyl-D-alanine carboxypeptidase [Borreliella burgdorferi]